MNINPIFLIAQENRELAIKLCKENQTSLELLALESLNQSLTFMRHAQESGIPEEELRERYEEKTEPPATATTPSGEELQQITLETPLDHLEVEGARFNPLAKAGVNTIEDYLALSREELEQIPRVGGSTLDGIDDALIELGFLEDEEEFEEEFDDEEEEEEVEESDVESDASTEEATDDIDELFDEETEEEPLPTYADVLAIEPSPAGVKEAFEAYAAAWQIPQPEARKQLVPLIRGVYKANDEWTWPDTIEVIANALPSMPDQEDRVIELAEEIGEGEKHAIEVRPQALFGKPYRKLSHGEVADLIATMEDELAELSE